MKKSAGNFISGSAHKTRETKTNGSENETARRLYARLGFVEYGIERKALKQHGRYYDEVLMAKDLAADGTDLKADGE